MHSAGINGLHQHTALVLAAKRFNEREEVARLSIGVDIRDQTIWEILKFCYRNQILGLIYRIRADAHRILVFTCLNPMDAEAN